MKKRSNSGFLLLEVLVAIVILTVGIAIILRSFNSSINTIKGLDDYLAATSLIEQKMFQLQTEGLNNVPAEGNFDSGYKKFSWKINSLPQQDLSIHKVDLSIIWDTANSKKSLLVQTYLNEPLSH